MTEGHEAKIRAEMRGARLLMGYAPVGVMRWLMKLPLYRVKLAHGVRTQLTRVGGVPGEWFEAETPGPVILYLHGGGFVYGASHLHRKMLSHLVGLTGGKALMADYRLAPEHPFPAGLDDCLAVYRALLAQGIAPENLIVAGDSAGAGLTLSTLLSLRDAGDPLPAAAVCLSPPSDLRLHDEEKWETAADALLHPRAVRLFQSAYVADSDATNPLLSPVFADLRGLPPLLVYAGGDEGLRDDIVRLVDAARAQGAPCEFHDVPKMWHVWQIHYPDVPEAVEAMHRIRDFISEHAVSPDLAHA